jgi:hypothetical protein
MTVKTPGKFTQGWTDFALKDGNLLSIMGINASMPGKSSPHLISSANILSIVASLRLNHGMKWAEW